MRPVVLTVALLAATFSASPALAGAQWCEADPVVLVNGAAVDVLLTFPQDAVSTIRGPIVYEVEVPANVLLTGSLTPPAPVPQEVRISRSLPPWLGVGVMPMVVHVSLRATDTFPTYTVVRGTTFWGGKFSLSETVKGRANSKTTIRFGLLAP